jgi:hypothetical protein
VGMGTPTVMGLHPTGLPITTVFTAPLTHRTDHMDPTLVGGLADHMDLTRLRDLILTRLMGLLVLLVLHIPVEDMEDRWRMGKRESWLCWVRVLVLFVVGRKGADLRILGVW